MKSAFTKAPWSKAYIEASFHHATKHLVPEDLLSGADIRRLNRGDVYLPAPHRVPMDLRLMSLAPELYGALVRASEILDDLDYRPDDSNEAEYLEWIRATIKAVEGPE